MAQRQVSDDHALQFLASEGYLPLALSDHPGMVEAYTQLFAQTSKFFNLPPDSPEKTNHQAASGAAASEEGYSQIPHEKCIMTVKTSTHCPSTLRPELHTAWDLTGAFLASITTAIAHTLSLDPAVFSPFVAPCTAFPPTERTPTLVRMFRYDRPAAATAGPRVNAEKHKDLGLLSLVVGRSPGLQALDPSSNAWVSVEDEANLPPGAVARSGGLTATLLAGETLAFLSRGVYRAGVHRVVCAPSAENNAADPYRFSIVYTLRAAPAPLFTRDFESGVVGAFGPGERVEGESSAVMFERIMRTHWNVNAAPGVREEQRRKFEGRNGGGGVGVESRQERASG
ncbi:hypothetical protein HO173_003688 [Letharia columbiana]|uniref:Fe2OG dioxygenase domain-containing protein n=1 Tax=Letharia columbiana TaxID=112416 RepID=A0A8H6G050_9LECA|nr:uncharacterized protein HO173_003688 [Letharia columbiana]KAF6238054.1 hypothetical protein HO173_003688 [Letharia columbiana]